MTETLNDCRAAFEAEMKRLRTFSTFMKNDGTGDYCDDYMQTKWSLWQAAWNQRPSEISGDEVERVAIAISPWRNGNKRMVDHWPGLREEVKEAYRAQAKAAIAAMSPMREMDEFEEGMQWKAGYECGFEAGKSPTPVRESIAGWQSIKTAPKDGTWVKFGWVHDADSRSGAIQEEVVVRYNTEDGYWINTNGGAQARDKKWGVWTHWQPITKIEVQEGK